MNNYFSVKGFSGIILFLFLYSSLSAQSTFYKKYDYAGDEFGNFVIETSDGGYAIIGSTNSFGSGNYDIWLLKTDSSGDTLWTKTFGGPDEDQGFCLRQTSDNGFMIAGYKTNPPNYTDGWVIKTDAAGNMDWDYTFGSDLNGESASAIVQDSENTFIVSGNYNSKSYAFKIDEEGNVIWEQSYFPNQNSSTSAICKSATNEFAIVGSFQTSSGGSWSPNMFTIDTDGNLGYQLTYSPNEGAFYTVAANADGALFFGGADDGENVVYKISSSGFPDWNYRYYQEVWYQHITSSTAVSDNNIIITDNTYYGSLRKINTLTGDTLWTRTSTFNTDYPKFNNLSTTSDNGLIITGYTDNHGLILLKTDQNGHLTGIESQPGIQKSISLNQNFPNPFDEQTELSFNISKGESVELYIADLNSRRIKTLLNKYLTPNRYQCVWDGTNTNGMDCPSGIYYAILKTNSGIFKTRKLIKY